jgi:hypothetical protein
MEGQPHFGVGSSGQNRDAGRTGLTAKARSAFEQNCRSNAPVGRRAHGPQRHADGPSFPVVFNESGPPGSDESDIHPPRELAEFVTPAHTEARHPSN